MKLLFFIKSRRLINSKIIKDPVETIRSLSKFLGNELNDEKIRTVIETTSFDTMKSKSKKAYDALIAMNFFKSDVNFFRKGQAGTWRDYFSPELSERFDKVIAEKLNYKGTFNYGPE